MPTLEPYLVQALSPSARNIVSKRTKRDCGRWTGRVACGTVLRKHRIADIRRATRGANGEHCQDDVLGCVMNCGSTLAFSQCSARMLDEGKEVPRADKRARPYVHVVF